MQSMCVAHLRPGDHYRLVYHGKYHIAQAPMHCRERSPGSTCLTERFAHICTIFIQTLYRLFESLMSPPISLPLKMAAISVERRWCKLHRFVDVGLYIKYASKSYRSAFFRCYNVVLILLSDKWILKQMRYFWKVRFFSIRHNNFEKKNSGAFNNKTPPVTACGLWIESEATVSVPGCRDVSVGSNRLSTHAKLIRIKLKLLTTLQSSQPSQVQLSDGQIAFFLYLVNCTAADPPSSPL